MGTLPALMNACFETLLLSDETMGHKIAVSEGDGARYPRRACPLATTPRATPRFATPRFASPRIARRAADLDNVSGAPEDMRKLTAIYYLNALEEEPGEAEGGEGGESLGSGGSLGSGSHGGEKGDSAEDGGGRLSVEWDVERLGGAIRLFDGLDAPSHTDVAPLGDRLLVFWSDLVVHEVLPSFATSDDDHRYTFTVWLVTHNAANLNDPRGPQYPLRVMYFPTREESQ